MKQSIFIYYIQYFDKTCSQVLFFIMTSHKFRTPKKETAVFLGS